MPDDTSFLDRLDRIANTLTNRWFDYKIADTQAEAEARLRQEQQERQSMLDQLTTRFSLGADSAGQYLSNLPAWVIPAAVLGFGGILFYRLAK